jgi:transcriptional regulator with GAF, ATPase, and Fis domain
MDRHEFGRRMAEAARGMSEARHPADTLQRIATMAVELIDACDVAGVCVLRTGRNDTCAHSHASLLVMDDLQHDLAEGPAMGGASTADMVSVDDLRKGAPWPRWGSEVADRTGVRAYLGFRLFVEDDSIGMLNLYAYEPAAFDHEDKLDGLVAAAHAAVALSATVRHDQLHTALTSRQVIGEATGILRERFALTSDQAFAVLKRLSSQQNIKLLAVAQQVVETGTLPGSAP